MEHRRETRIQRNLSISVHVHECEERPELVGNSIPCEATDFSPKGLQFSSDLLLEPKTLVNINIGVGNPFSTYLLFGEVRWAMESDGEMAMGLRLTERKRNDLKRWIEDFDTIFEEELHAL